MSGTRAPRSPLRIRAKLAAALALTVLIAPPSPARASPVTTQMAGQRLSVKVKRLKGTGTVVKQGIKAKVISKALQWDYIQGTSVSVPFITLQFQNIPLEPGYTVLAERSGKLAPDSKDGYVIRLPLLKTENPLLLTVVDASGNFEDWEIQVIVTLAESAVYVDETCKDYALKIKELKRPLGPNLLYIGCRLGAGPRDISLDILWSDIVSIEYLSQNIKAESSVLTVPLESRHHSESQLTGIHASGARSLYQLEYEPYTPPPYELWIGLAMFKSSFTQSNFAPKFSQTSTAFLGQFWYRPEDVDLSLMFRGFGSLLSMSSTLTPDQGYQEASSTFFADGEIRYRILNKKGWKIDPFFGGWAFFMNVKSRNFGVQRIVDPILGLVISREIGKRDNVFGTIRVVPLQSYFNPLAFKTSQSYIEFELTYARTLKQRNRLFGTLYLGNLNYAPPDLAKTTGSYMVLGGGYGW